MEYLFCSGAESGIAEIIGFITYSGMAGAAALKKSIVLAEESSMVETSWFGTDEAISSGTISSAAAAGSALLKSLDDVSETTVSFFGATSGAFVEVGDGALRHNKWFFLWQERERNI